MSSKPRIVMDRAQINRTLGRITAEILEGGTDPAIVGIRTRGVHLAQRLSEKIHKDLGAAVDFGILDINLYRDDLSLIADHPVLKKTEIPFSIEGRRLILVDDVLYTGRTVRAALDAIIDLGRPRVISLAVLVDRGHRELPIQADYIGLELQTRPDQWVRVLVGEEDGQDGVELGEVAPEDLKGK